MQNISELVSGINTLWTLVAAALVFFMQAGFAMVETGFTRAKNAGHIGDGKIFIYSVLDAIKVRTGETGYYAMQGEE